MSGALITVGVDARLAATDHDFTLRCRPSLKPGADEAYESLKMNLTANIASQFVMER